MNSRAYRRPRRASFAAPSTVGTVATNYTSAGSGRPPTLWRAFAGFGLWAVCFTVLYTGHALACTLTTVPSGDVGAPLIITGGVTWLLASIWMFFVLWLAVLALRSGAGVRRVTRWLRNSRERTRAGEPADYRLQIPESTGWAIVHRRSLRFMIVLTFAVDVSSIAITVISGLPVILTPACL